MAEWIPVQRRSTAMGIINAGTAVGSVLAPLSIGLVLLKSGWRMVFFASGALGMAWVVWWSRSYRGNHAVPVATLDARAIAQRLSFAGMVGMR